MKKINLNTPVCTLLFLASFVTSCSGQPYSQGQGNTTDSDNISKTGTPISGYVVDVYEDKKGSLWFGTISDGVARFDGKSLTYFTTKDGLCDNTVVSITEDREGNIWLGTHAGLSKFDGSTFTNFTANEGLCNDRVSNVLVDSKGQIWVGTWEGVCQFDGTTFTDFPLPIPDIEVPVYQATENWVTEIIEDRQGHIWFARSGYGVCRYDGKAFTQFTKKEGLPSNCVQAILEDRQGHIWFGSRVAENDHPDADKRTGEGGLCRYDGKTFQQFPGIKGLSKNDIYSIHEDKAGNIWIGATGVGVYRYDGQNFRMYKGTNRRDLTYRFGVQSILADSKETLWFGFSGGLFRLKGSSIVHVPREEFSKQD